jgi:molybdate transport system regulatory protein
MWEGKMKISARNVFEGKITEVKIGAVSCEVNLKTKGGEKIVAMVTNESAIGLGLATGKEALALVKASSVLVLIDPEGYRLSARNSLRGRIAQIKEGPVSAEVSIALRGDDAVHATITREAVAELGLKVGDAASAVFKAGAVIIAARA